MNPSLASSLSHMFYSIPTPTPSTQTVTREEFNAFHKIDRTLFSRLVFALERNLNQSFDVFGFLYMLEQAGYVRNLIAYLVTLADAQLDAVADEIVVCLKFLYNKDYATTFFVANNNSEGQSIIPLVYRVTEGRINLMVIDQNREIFFAALRKHLSEFCLRAFDDICARAERENVIKEMNKMRLNVQKEQPTKRMNVQQEWVRVPQDKRVAKGEEEVVLDSPDDRTVFLTFSKGYPISEEEVRVYFTRKFGDLIEAVEMQEVEMNEQPLYAKMVVRMRYASKIEDIVCGRNRNKFTINGKHVWARRYVRKSAAFASSSSYA